MQTLEQYEQGWLARGRVPSVEQRRGLVVAHRKARIAPYVIGLGAAVVVASLIALTDPSFRPVPSVFGLLAAASLVLAGSLARGAFVAALEGSLRAKQLSTSGTATWLAAVLCAVAVVAALAAAVTGRQPQSILLVVAMIPAAIAPWFIK